MADRIAYARERGLEERMRAAALQHHATLEEVLGRNQHRRVARARAAVCASLRALDFGCVDIAMFMGRSASTVAEILRAA